MTEKREAQVFAVTKDSITYGFSAWNGPVEPGEVGHYEWHKVTETHTMALHNTRRASFGPLIAEAIRRGRP